MAENNNGPSINFVHFCAYCKIPEADKDVKLKLCTKCRGALYCSRECQKADWKEHKKTCAKTSEGETSVKAHIYKAPLRSHTRNLSVIIEKPFHKLHDRTWLHGRSEEDVFKILIDSFRLRLQDDFSGYGGPRVAPERFIKFLRMAARRQILLPDWWSEEKMNQCITYGMRNDVWSCLKNPTTKAEIIEHYGHPYFPMQLRLFGEQVIGIGPFGHSGTEMIQLQMAMENTGNFYYTGMDLSSYLPQS